MVAEFIVPLTQSLQSKIKKYTNKYLLFVLKHDYILTKTMTIQTNVLTSYMGDAFFRLAPKLQQAHVGHVCLRGWATVERGNWLAHLICNVMRFPKASQRCELKVECKHSKTRMEWKRNFAGVKMESYFEIKKDFLLEKLGMLKIYFNAIEENTSLHYKPVFMTYFGLRLPKFISPLVIAYESEVDDKYRFFVDVKMPLIGRVIAYNGELDVITLFDG